MDNVRIHQKIIKYLVINFNILAIIRHIYFFIIIFLRPMPEF